MTPLLFYILLVIFFVVVLVSLDVKRSKGKSPTVEIDTRSRADLKINFLFIPVSCASKCTDWVEFKRHQVNIYPLDVDGIKQVGRIRKVILTSNRARKDASLTVYL